MIGPAGTFQAPRAIPAAEHSVTGVFDSYAYTRSYLEKMGTQQLLKMLKTIDDIEKDFDETLDCDVLDGERALIKEILAARPAATLYVPPNDTMPLEKLQTFHTRALLAALRKTYHNDGWDDQRDVKDAYRERLKAILATRPHVPSKTEAREARIARKKSGKPRSKAKR